MKFANKEQINKLVVLENEYYELKETYANETARCILRGELVKGFVKSVEMVDEAIEKLTKKIETLKLEKTNNKNSDNKKIPQIKSAAPSIRNGGLYYEFKPVKPILKYPRADREYNPRRILQTPRDCRSPT